MFGTRPELTRPLSCVLSDLTPFYLQSHEQSCSGCKQFFLFSLFDHIIFPPLNETASFSTPALILPQKVDHFNSTDFRTFNQSYYLNSTYYNSTNSIILFINSEQTTTESAIFSSSVFSLASATNSLFAMLELRFYGASFPVPSLTTRELTRYHSQRKRVPHHKQIFMFHVLMSDSLCLQVHDGLGAAFVERACLDLAAKIPSQGKRHDYCLSC
jgi:hypothetical protein